MRIEILTRNMDKKAELLTLWAAEPSFASTGGKIVVDGVQVEVGPDYLLLTIDDWRRGEQVLPRLFSISPCAYAPSYCEPVTDQKILVTAAARPLPEIIENLDVLEHLDMEKGELAGAFQRRWQSRDVAVVAPVEVMVQGGVAVARIKFLTHFRDGEHHCRLLLEMISLREMLTVFTSEITRRCRPRAVPPCVTARHSVTGQDFSRFLNDGPEGVIYRPEQDEYLVQFGGCNYLSFHPGRERNVELELHIEDCTCLTERLTEQLTDILHLEQVSMEGRIADLLLEPRQLLGELNFRKDEDYHIFTRESAFLARYDIQKLEMQLRAAVDLRAPAVGEIITGLYRDMLLFIERVLAGGA